mmetsp:Transcript_1188/g.2611  ORF Transcript_1188/g.2611 Transcript_1188/m.2611 type:complete len:221 (-) Transcript_1188:2140-2802(-)
MPRESSGQTVAVLLLLRATSATSRFGRRDCGRGAAEGAQLVPRYHHLQVFKRARELQRVLRGVHLDEPSAVRSLLIKRIAERQCRQRLHDYVQSGVVLRPRRREMMRMGRRGISRGTRRCCTRACDHPPHLLLLPPRRRGLGVLLPGGVDPVPARERHHDICADHGLVLRQPQNRAVHRGDALVEVRRAPFLLLLHERELLRAPIFLPGLPLLEFFVGQL